MTNNEESQDKENKGIENIEGLFKETLPLLRTIRKFGSEPSYTLEHEGSGLNTDYVQISLVYKDENNQEQEECFFIKEFKNGERKGSPALEFSLLKGYREEGTNVPQPYKYGRRILILSSIKGNSLERKLYENRDNEGKRINLIERAIWPLEDLHCAGRRIQGSFLSNVDLRNSLDLTGRAESHFIDLVADQDELISISKNKENKKEIEERIKERCKDIFPIFESFFEIIANHFRNQETQLIHGDMATYHVRFDENEIPWYIDFGNPKFANVTFDYAPLYFSQDTNLKVEIIEDIHRRYLMAQMKRVTEEEIDREIKSLFLSGCQQNVRRGAKYRKLSLVYPEKYSKFIEKHPTYDLSLVCYRDLTSDILKYFLGNKQKYHIDKEEVADFRRMHRAIGKFLDKDNYRPPNASELFGSSNPYYYSKETKGIEKRKDVS